MGVDAFRVDTTRHISRLTFNKVFNNAFKAAGERNGKDFFMFGEVCTRDNGNVWYRQSPSMSTPFYTWKDTKDYPWSDTDWEVNYESAIQNTRIIQTIFLNSQAARTLCWTETTITHLITASSQD